MVGLSMSYVYELDDDFDGDLNDKASRCIKPVWTDLLECAPALKC